MQLCICGEKYIDKEKEIDRWFSKKKPNIVYRRFDVKWHQMTFNVKIATHNINLFTREFSNYKRTQKLQI